MIDRFFTIVIIPKKNSKVRKIKISTRFFKLAVFLSLLLVFAWSLMIYDYFVTRSKLSNDQQIAEYFQEQKKSILHFQKLLEKLQLRFDHLRELNFKLRVLTSLEAEHEPISQSTTTQGHGELLELATNKGILSVITSETSKSNILEQQGEKKFKQLVDFLKAPRNPMNNIPNGWPTRGYLKTNFGKRLDPIDGQESPFYGIDIASASFSPVLAPAAGIILAIEKDEYFGNILTLDHGNGFVTRYGHLYKIVHAIGSTVSKGELIAKVGNSGRSSGPHVYYEVSLNGVPQNPMTFIHN